MHFNEAHFCEDSGLGCCSSIRAMAALISRKEVSMAPCPGMVLMGLGSASKGRQGELKRREKPGGWGERLNTCREGLAM